MFEYESLAADPARPRRPFAAFARTVAKCAAASALVGAPLGVVSGAGAFADAEALLFKAIREVRTVQLDAAMRTIAQLIDRHPNYRLAHLIQGDLLLAKAKPLQTIGNPLTAPAANPLPAPAAESVDGLRAEAQVRLQRAQESIASDKIPSNFWRVAQPSQYAMALDVDRSRLYVFENREGQLQRIADFYATVGKEGSGKAKEGDQRTPIGAYTLQSAVPRQKLTDFYGAGAFPLDYPNDWDRRLGRSGYGIWLHGVGSDTFARAPRASDGCIVVSNPDLQVLEKFIVPGRTPIVVAQTIDWVDRGLAAKQATAVLTAFERWRGDMQSLDLPRYFQNYGVGFAADGVDYYGWEAQRRSLFGAMSWAKVQVSNVSAVQYPGTRDVALVTFDQSFSSNKFNSELKKRQLWQLAADGRWRIIFEGNS